MFFDFAAVTTTAHQLFLWPIPEKVFDKTFLILLQFSTFQSFVWKLDAIEENADVFP